MEANKACFPCKRFYICVRGAATQNANIQLPGYLRFWWQAALRIA
jgi:hypothetical protein